MDESAEARAGITLRGLSKRFGTTVALDGVDLDIGGGELVALLGPSGSGKSTLLRVVAGLEQVDDGMVLFGGEDTTNWPVQARRVGFVFQSYALFRHLTVAGNIAYGLRVRPRHARPSDAEIRKRVGDLLDLVQLPGMGGRFPSQLSGGQRQRVALARALAVEPRVLLLDEPFGALDAQVRRDLRRWLRAIHDQTGHTTLFVTHDQDEALELADRVAILHRGRLEQFATPDQIYDAPATAFVAGFVGDAVRLQVNIRGGVGSAGSLRLTGVGPDGPAALFIRPTDLVLDPAGQPVTVLAVRRTSTGRRAEVSFGTGLPPAELNVPAETAVEIGATVHVVLPQPRLFRQ